MQEAFVQAEGGGVMRFLCLCPTYGRPPFLIENAIKCFLDQTHKDATLLIYDDLGNYPSNMVWFCDHPSQQAGLWSTSDRSPGIVAKYNRMLDLPFIRDELERGVYDAIALWDDDDVYLPTHLEQHAKALENHELSYPSEVLSTYTQKVETEKSGGRFWASLAIRMKSFSDIGGFVETERADFDQQSLSKFRKMLSTGDPCEHGGPTYVFRWGDTRVSHSQWHMRSPDDTSWYSRVTPAFSDKVEEVIPRYMDNTVAMALEHKIKIK
jgi:hypothetical protein